MDMKLNFGLQSIRAFGIVKGLLLYLKVSLGRQLIRFKLPGFSQDLFMRPRTTDLQVFCQIFLEHLYEIESICRRPNLIIDIGANVGYASVYFSHLYPEAEIISVECDPGNYEMLVRNTKGYENIRCINAALWPRNCRLHIANPGDGEWAYRVEEDSQGPIKGVTMHDLVTGRPDRIDLLKLDIEGGEIKLFAGDCTSWLDRVNFFIVETHDIMFPGCAKALYNALHDYDFRQYVMGDSVVIDMRRNVGRTTEGPQPLVNTVCR